MLLKGFWVFPGGRRGRSTCVLLAHRRDSRPPYLVKRLLYKWKTSGGTNSGWPLAGSQKHRCSPLGVSEIWETTADSGTICRSTLWIECGALGTGLSSRIISTRADPGLDAGGVCPHLQPQENGELSPSALQIICTCCPA